MLPLAAVTVGLERTSPLVDALTRIGVEPIVTADAELALWQLGRRRADLLVTSLAPAAAGAASLIRSARARAAVPALVAAPREAWLEALNVGADGQLFTPCSVDVVNERVEEALAAAGREVPPLLSYRYGDLTLRGRGGFVSVEPPMPLSPVQRVALAALVDAGGRGVGPGALAARWDERLGATPRASVAAELDVLAADLERAAGQPVIGRAGDGWALRCTGWAGSRSSNRVP